MDTVWLEMLGVIVMIALVSLFSASEVSVLSVRKSRIKELADAGVRNAATIRTFQLYPEQFLATVHVGIIFTLILSSGLGGVIAFEHLLPSLQSSGTPWISEASGWISLAVMVLTLGTLVVVFGELVPKSLALRNAEAVALRLAAPMRLFTALFRYPALMLTTGSNLILRPFKESATFSQSRISEEEFRLILDEGTASGVIDKTEHDLITSIFEFTDTAAKEVMIPRPDVVALNIDMPREQLVKVVLEEGYSRMPVYKESIDNIIGIVYTKDLLGLMEYRDLIIIQDIVRPAYFVPETMKISRLMRELQERKLHMAVVIDEFGGTEGIITMEDILEEIVGEIHDEYDEVLKDIDQAADGSFLVNARVSVKDFNTRFQAELPETEEYETIGGFLSKLTGRIPDLNEEITHQLLQFAIVKKSQRRIRMVKVRKLLPPDQSRIAGEFGRPAS